MSTLTVRDTVARRRKSDGGAFGGLPWTVLRLHRTALLLWAAVLLAGVGVLIWMYAIGADAQAGLGPCAMPATDTLPSCSTLEALNADETYGIGLGLTGIALSCLMFPVAAWAGAALIGRELESGTAQLAWTQSVTPMRWLTAKLAVPAALLTTGATLLVLLNVWARRDDNPNLVGDWYNSSVFVSTGPVAVASVLAGLALGALAGLAVKKTLPAAGVAFAATLVLYNVLDWYRPSLWPADTVTGRAALHLPRSSLVLEHGAVTDTGERVGNNLACIDSDSAADIKACMTRSGLTDFWATHHPESHFWPLQLMESGVLLAVAGLATVIAFRLLRRRTP
ncbi:hypothetical protein [Streptomyces sp. NPDC001530]|uniref:hypothetical protein n=1 Tax=Streptomyces sp. NPDC001530 TaxID=3364582 RepID=UPI0036A3F6CE